MIYFNFAYSSLVYVKYKIIFKKIWEDFFFLFFSPIQTRWKFNIMAYIYW